MNNKIKILFHYSRLNIGGAERSTLRLMKALVDNGWDVTLVLNVGDGSLEKKIDSRIKVIHFFPKPWKAIIVNQKNKLVKIILLIYYALPILYYSVSTIIIKNRFKNKKYDAAIISLQGLDPKFVCEYVHAKKRFLYIRNDLREIPKKSVYSNIKKYNDCLNGYLCVSNTALESLDTINNIYKEKAYVLYNIIDFDNIITQANAEKDPFFKYRKENIPILVTVCRMADVAKAIFRQLEIAIELKSRGIEFQWFFVGDGPDLGELRKRIVENKMENSIFVLGEKNNPYPYIKYSDVVCVLSYFEGLAGVVNEAKTLGKPVIATQFSGINEQLIDEENGLIVENDYQSILKGLERLLTDRELRVSLQNNFLGSGIDDNNLKIATLKKIIEK